MAGEPLDNDGNLHLVGNRKVPKGGAKLAKDSHARRQKWIDTVPRSNRHGVLCVFLAGFAVRKHHHVQCKRVLFS